MAMKVKDVMTREPITVDPEAPLGTAMEVMRRKRIRHLPVVNDAGRLMGIITDRDLGRRRSRRPSPSTCRSRPSAASGGWARRSRT